MGLLGILHFSDVHFAGDVNNRRLTSTPLLSRANGHALPLASGLAFSVGNVRRQLVVPKDDFYFVMSGDATATGSEQEFAMAHTYIKNGWHRTCFGCDGIGLGLDVISQNPRLVKVPGNHDQWQGFMYPGRAGFTPSLKGTHFEHTPWHHVWQAGDLQIDLIGIDSNAGLGQRYPSISQRGAIEPMELQQVDAILTKLESSSSDVFTHRISVLVIHHSLASDLYMERPSITALKNMIARHDVAVVLTGHTHDFLARHVLNPQGKKIGAVELRAASATQGPDNRVRPAPGFLAHRIETHKVGMERKVRWSTFRYQWNVLRQEFTIVTKDAANPFFRRDITC